MGLFRKYTCYSVTMTRPFIQSCCWWNNVTYGSYGSAVYSFLIGGIFTILVMFDVRPFHFFGTAERGPAINIGSYLQIVSGICLCISACCLVVGVYHGTKQLLIPWIISMLLFTVILITGNVHLCLRKYELQDHAGADALVIVVSVVFSLLNIYGGLCVVSLYQILCQEYANRNPPHGISFILPEKASIRYFRRTSYDPTDSWPESTPNDIAVIKTAERAAPPTVTIHRESQLRSSIIKLPPLPIPTPHPVAALHSDKSDIPIYSTIVKKVPNPVIKQAKQVRIQAPDRLQKG